MPPVTGSVKKSPSIKEHISDPQPLVPEATKTPDEPVNVEVQEKEIVEKIETEAVKEIPVVEEINQEEEAPVVEEQQEESFEEHWQKVIKLYYEKMPTVYYALKEYPPEIIDQTIYIKIKNELQKEQIEMHLREVIAYLRNNYTEKIEGIEVLLDEAMESKVKVIDEREKLNMLKEENPSLPEFMQELKLVAKE